MRKRAHNFINSFNAKNKQNDKLQITVRLGKLTVLDFYLDGSAREFRLMVMNNGYETK